MLRATTSRVASTLAIKRTAKSSSSSSSSSLRNPSLFLAAGTAAALLYRWKTPGEARDKEKTVVYVKNKKLMYDWTVYNKLGAGAYGVVKLGKCNNTGQVAAVKIVDTKRERPRKAFTRELNTLIKIRELGGHENIASYKDVYFEEDLVCLVTELVDGGELFDHFSKYGVYTEEGTKHIIKDIAKALYFLHKNGVVHLDVKMENIILVSPENIVYDTTCCKLVDFGSATLLNDNMNHTRDKTAYQEPSDEECVGTPAYWPPECFNMSERRRGKRKFSSINGIRQHSKPTAALDMWALGCIAFILLTGTHPFDVEGNTKEDVLIDRISKHSEISFDAQSWKNISEDAKNVIQKLMHQNPKERMSARDLLSHSWIKEGEVTEGGQ